MINKKLDSEKNSQLNNRYIKQNTDTKNNMNIKVNINANSKSSNEQEENIKAFRKAYYDLLYHYDNTKE